jgi:hypothetical protein
VDRVVQAGGLLPLDPEDNITNYERLITASKRSTNLPFGKQLRMRSVGPYWPGKHEIYLDEDVATAAGARAAAYHAAVKEYQSDRDRHEVSQRPLGRACPILQALATESERRGYTVRSVGNRQGQPLRLAAGQLEITIDGLSLSAACAGAIRARR